MRQIVGMVPDEESITEVKGYVNDRMGDFSVGLDVEFAHYIPCKCMHSMLYYVQQRRLKPAMDLENLCARTVFPSV
jgi:hypothetical protein